MADRFEIHPAGIKALLKDRGVASVVDAIAYEIAAAADRGSEDGGHVVTTRDGRTRHRASVEAESFEARVAETYHRNLSSAFANALR